MRLIHNGCHVITYYFEAYNHVPKYKFENHLGVKIFARPTNLARCECKTITVPQNSKDFIAQLLFFLNTKYTNTIMCLYHRIFDYVYTENF